MRQCCGGEGPQGQEAAHRSLCQSKLVVCTAANTVEKTFLKLRFLRAVSPSLQDLLVGVGINKPACFYALLITSCCRKTTSLLPYLNPRLVMGLKSAPQSYPSSLEPNCLRMSASQGEALLALAISLVHLKPTATKIIGTGCMATPMMSSGDIRYSLGGTRLHLPQRLEAFTLVGETN